MKIRALVPWYGSKRGLAPVIAEELGPHSAYWEPFCGSMAPLLAKDPASSETVNDLHVDLINLARCMQDRRIGPSLYRRLRRTINSEVLFRAARARVLDRADVAPVEPDEDRAFDYFLASWQGMNGVAGTYRYKFGFARRLTRNGGHAARRFCSVVDSIPAFRRRLRNVTVLSCDGIELCEEIEDATGVVIYADPPYLAKGDRYRHDFTPADHLRLASALRRFRRTRVVVSYYDHPDLPALYPGWTVRRLFRAKALVSQGAKGRKNDAIAPEVLLINGRSLSPGYEGVEDPTLLPFYEKPRSRKTAIRTARRAEKVSP